MYQCIKVMQLVHFGLVLDYLNIKHVNKDQRKYKLLSISIKCICILKND